MFNCQYFYPEYVTASSLAFDAAKALSNAGFTVDALCGYPKEYCNERGIPSEETVDGVNIRRVRYLQLDRKNPLGRLINYISFFISMLFQFFNLKHYKIIVTYSTPHVLPFLAAMAGKFFGTKHIFVCFDVYPEIAVNSGATREKSLMSSFMRFVNKRVYIRAAKVVALSTEMRDFIINNRDISPENVVVIPNWHKDLKEKNSESDEALCLKKKPFTVSYLGNMGTCQDMDTIISAMELLKDDENIRFVFAGHGNKVADMEKASEKFGNGKVYGFLQGDEYKRVLSDSDCYLVSLEKSIVGLGVPSKTYSYMMMGKPIISIMDDCDINRDIEAYNCGFAIKNNDPRALVSAIQKIARNPELQKEMGEGSRRVFEEKYTADICLKSYVDMLNDLI